MPIYEYQCGSCGHRLEAFQKMTETPLLDCPKCQKPRLQKLVSAAGFQLKGTGWYATDFRNKDNKSQKPSETKEEAKTTSDSKSTDASSDTSTGSKEAGTSS